MDKFMIGAFLVVAVIYSKLKDDNIVDFLRRLSLMFGFYFMFNFLWKLLIELII